MASLASDPNGLKRILFIGRGRPPRKCIRLGKISDEKAAAVFARIEDLEIALRTGHNPSRETILWIDRLERSDPPMLEKLAKHGLIEPREAAMLGPFTNGYLDRRRDEIKPHTMRNCRQAQKRLLEFFGAGKLLRNVTPADADAYRAWLFKEGLCRVTVNRECGRAKQFFRAALRGRLISENPFGDIECKVLANPTRDFDVTPEITAKLLEHCGSPEWKLLIALARFGGLRIPSEAVALRWEHVIWATGREGDADYRPGRIRVQSPKTAHHEGHAERIIPIFPELLPYLEDAFARAEDRRCRPPRGEEFVVTAFRETAANLRTQFRRIIKRAGLTPWEKPFHNCRRTREQELSRTYGLHLAALWIGNSPSVAMKHYVRAGEADLALAARQATALPAARPAGKAAQNAAQQPSEIGGNAPRPKSKTPDLHGISQHCETLQTGGYPRRESNIPPKPRGNKQTGPSAAQNAAQLESGLADPLTSEIQGLLCDASRSERLFVRDALRAAAKRRAGRRRSQKNS